MPTCGKCREGKVYQSSIQDSKIYEFYCGFCDCKNGLDLAQRSRQPSLFALAIEVCQSPLLPQIVAALKADNINVAVQLLKPFKNSHVLFDIVGTEKMDELSKCLDRLQVSK